MKNIDWKNHFVAFLSALIGLVIAFRLEEYRENSEEMERLNTAYDLVIKEIENNINIYEQNVEEIGDWLIYYEAIEELHKGKEYSTVVSLKTYRTITEDSSKLGRLRTTKLFDIDENGLANRVEHQDLLVDFSTDSTVKLSIEDSISGNEILDVHVYYLPITGISTSAWKSSVNSGIFTKLSPLKLNQLTQLYYWIENDFGRNEYAFYEDEIKIERGKTDDIDRIHYTYKLLHEVQQAKLKRIKPLFKEVLNQENKMK